MFSKIAKIIIGGRVSGTSASGDTFGFVSEEIGFFKADGAVVALRAGRHNDLAAIGSTGDVNIREI